MSGSKHFDRIAVLVTAIVLVITVLFMNGAALGMKVTAAAMGYENRLFDNTKVHTIDIVMNDWDDMIDNATSEEYYMASVVIDGESYKNVGIRTKGNTSLSTVADLGSERYSFKIEFDHYDSTKSYHGLDKLCLNNLIQDATMMKDYLTYTMMRAFGVNASLCSYVYITVNGADWGLYLAVEGVEEAFLERNYGADYGELYKPDSISFGGDRGNGGSFDRENFDFNGAKGEPSQTDDPFGGSEPSAVFHGGKPDMAAFGDAEMPTGFDPSAQFGGTVENDGFGMGADDVKLQYIDEDPNSYSNIWNNAKTDITEADQNRLIASLQKLSGYEDIASVVDVEQVIRYFVVHNYVCNGDSYTGSMVHNYYLYEKDGKLSMIPWDYNLAFGTFTGGDATGTVNTPIDTPVSGGSADRPMLHWIFESEEYTEAYHRYFAAFLSSVDTAGIVDAAYDLIKDYVAGDPTAFYSYDAFELGVETIRRFCALRSESISLQLENNETTADMHYVDASGITLSDMGSMGGGMGDMPGTPDTKVDLHGAMSDAPGTDAQGTAATNEDGDGTLPGGFPGEMPDNLDPSHRQGGLDGNFPDPSFGDENANAPLGDPEGNREYGEDRPDDGNMQRPGGDFSLDRNGNDAPPSDRTAWLWLAMSVVVLAVGLLIAKLYKH